jgi:hypothetical protein
MPPKKSSKASPPKSASKPASKAKKPASDGYAGAAQGEKKRKRSPTPPTDPAQLKAILSFLVERSSKEFGNGSDAQQPNLFDHMAHSASYTPFQSLVAAVVMSKPISSRLGSRTLLTIFAGAEGVTDGVDFSTPQKIIDAGEDGR